MANRVEQELKERRIALDKLVDANEAEQVLDIIASLKTSPISLDLLVRL